MNDEARSLQEIAHRRAATARERHALLAAELFAAPRGLVTDLERSLLAGMMAGLVTRIVAKVDAAAGNDAEATVTRLRGAGILSDPEVVGAAYYRMREAEIQRHATGADAVAALASGKDLEVIHAVNEYRVWRAGRLDGYGHPVLDEGDLPEPALTRLYWAVAAARGLGDPAREDVIEAATIGELAALRDAPPSPPEVAARRFVEAGLATGATIISLLDAGDITLALSVLAALAAIPVALARRFLFELGGEMLAVAAKVGGLDRSVLVALIAAGRGARAEGEDSTAALALFNRLDAETATAVLRRLARHPAYLEAARRLEA